jgi:hypothetical protein
MINRQGGESRVLDHIVNTSRIRKKTIQTASKDTGELEGLLKAKKIKHMSGT